jgi:hypothetical protein
LTGEDVGWGVKTGKRKKLIMMIMLWSVVIEIVRLLYFHIDTNKAEALTS